MSNANSFRQVGAGKNFLSPTDFLIEVDTSQGAVEIVLPKIATILNEYTTIFQYLGIRFVDISDNASANNITIEGFETDLVNGATTIVLNTNGVGGFVTLIGNGQWSYQQNASSSGGGNAVIEEGTGLNSSVRIDSCNSVLGAYSTALGRRNCVDSNYSSILGGDSNYIRNFIGKIVEITPNPFLGSLTDQVVLVSPSSQTGLGENATFVISIRSNKIKASPVNGGENYEPFDTLTFSGTLFGGTSPTDDVVLVVTGVTNVESDYSAIMGGQINTNSEAFSTIINGRKNSSNGEFATVSNGYMNTASSYKTSVDNGAKNTASSPYSTVSNGYSNNSTGGYSSVLNGGQNSATGSFSSIGNGQFNQSSESYSTVSNGYCNTASGNNSTVSNGYCNSASNGYSTVLNGSTNTASGNSSLVANGSCNLSCADYSSIINGFVNTASAYYTTVLGGRLNIASQNFSVVSNGVENTASGYCSTVSNGYNNIASGNSSTVSNGYRNTASGSCSTIINGTCNFARGNGSFIAGGDFNSDSCFACAFIVGSSISADRSCATFVNNLSIKNIPTSSAGLPSGSVWFDSVNDKLTIVP